MKSERDPSRMLEQTSSDDAFLRQILRAGTSEAPTADQISQVTQHLAAATGSVLHVLSSAPQSAVLGSSTAVTASRSIPWFVKAIGLASTIVVVGVGVSAMKLRPAPASHSTSVVHASITPIEHPMVAVTPIVEHEQSQVPSTIPTPIAVPERISAHNANSVERPHRIAAETTTHPAALSPARVDSENNAPVADPNAQVIAVDTQGTGVELLSEARVALRNGDAAHALALTAQHERQFANGILIQEREVIAIQALVQLHRVDQARERIRAFDSRFQNSSHRRQLDALLGQ